MSDKILHAILSKVYRLGATEAQNDVPMGHRQQVEPKSQLPFHSFYLSAASGSVPGSGRLPKIPLAFPRFPGQLLASYLSNSWVL